MSEPIDLTSTKPEDLRRMADEAIIRLKEQLAELDAKQAPHYHRLVSYAHEARDDSDRQRYEDLSRQASRYRADWGDARQPYIQQIQRIAMARDDITPRTMTFTWARGVFADVHDLDLPA